MRKTSKFLAVFFVFTVVLLMLGIFVDKESPLLGRKSFFLIGIYLVLFYEGIKRTITQIGLPENKLTELMCFIISTFWGFSAALFFMLGVTWTPAVSLLGTETYIKWVVAHTFYISVWILILYKIQSAIAGLFVGKNILHFLAAIATFAVIGLTVWFGISAGMQGYSPLHVNPLFVLIEALCLVMAVVIFIETVPESPKIILNSIPLLVFLLFVVLTKVGRLAFERMRYDFVFFGPTLLSLGVSLEIIIRRVIRDFGNRLAK